jgi:hypothetical protein
MGIINEVRNAVANWKQYAKNSYVSLIRTLQSKEELRRCCGCID